MTNYEPACEFCAENKPVYRRACSGCMERQRLAIDLQFNEVTLKMTQDMDEVWDTLHNQKQQ